MRRVLLGVCVLMGLAAVPARAIDDAHEAKAKAAAAKAVTYLRSQQEAKTGGWGVKQAGPQLPAITGLVLNGMLMEPGIDATDPAVAKGAAYMLSFRKPSGAIYDKILPSYNTSICLSALARLKTPEAEAAVKPAQTFLKGLQYSEAAVVDPETDEAPQRVGPEDPFYGGVGYGSHGRPDNSNLFMMLQALHDSGVKGDDEAFQRALVFMRRTQMDEKINEMEYAKGSRQGGFIYATGPDADHKGVGQSETNVPVEETLDNGEKVSRLRAYGSMTYGGFKSMVYAELKKDDPRVKAAFEWIRRNYTVQENPGIGNNGMYYYFLTMARAMKVWGEPTIKTATAAKPASAEKSEQAHDWANELIDRLAELQQPDGSFKSLDKRWMEDDRVLITAYGLLALENALGR
jgi:squalene-hopene/tetraprenyl-beta-curcumene cyclase